MINITVCVGSSCFKRGAGEVVDAFQRLIESNRLEAQVELKGSFCMDRCTEGTTVKIGDRVFCGVFARDIPRLFHSEVLSRL